MDNGTDKSRRRIGIGDDIYVGRGDDIIVSPAVDSTASRAGIIFDIRILGVFHQGIDSIFLIGGIISHIEISMIGILRIAGKRGEVRLKSGGISFTTETVE